MELKLLYYKKCHSIPLPPPPVDSSIHRLNLAAAPARKIWMLWKNLVYFFKLTLVIVKVQTQLVGMEGISNSLN